MKSLADNLCKMILTAIEQKKETLEHRDYVQEMQVETAKDGYQFTFVIADIDGYEGENSINQTL